MMNASWTGGYLGSGGNSRQNLANDEPVRLVDVLDTFFVARPMSGRKEGEEHNRVMYFMPNTVSIAKQTDVTGFAEAVVNFTDNFASSRVRQNERAKDHTYRFVSTKKSQHAYVVVENEEFVLGLVVDRQKSQELEYPIFPLVLKNILLTAYRMFCLTFGSMSSLFSEDESRFKLARLGVFFADYIPQQKLCKAAIYDTFTGVSQMSIPGRLYMSLESFVVDLTEEFPEIGPLLLLHHYQMVYYSSDKCDVVSLFRYLTLHLLPSTVHDDLQLSTTNAPSGRFLLNGSDPTSAVRSIFLKKTPQDGSDGQSSTSEPRPYLLLVYRHLSTTLCMLVERATDQNTENDKRSAWLRRLELWLRESALSDLDGKLSDVLEAEVTVPLDYRFFFYNASNQCIQSNLLNDIVSERQTAPDLPPVSAAASQLAYSLLEESILKDIDDKDDVQDIGESLAQTAEEIGWWVSVRQVHGRLLVVWLPPIGNVAVPIADAQKRVAAIVQDKFKSYFII